MKEEELTPIDGIGRQLIFRKLAQYCVNSTAEDYYHFVEAINLLMAEVDGKKVFGDKYDAVKIVLRNTSYIANKIKMFYDALADKKLDEKKKEAHLKLLVKKELEKLVLFQSNIYIIFVKLIKATALRNFQIPTICFKLEDRSEKRLLMDKSKKEKKGEEK